jgi:serine/threonine protein kinase
MRSESRYGGTLCYMALEVVRNKPNDFQADFYSLGVLMFKMITGSVPYNSKDRKEMIKLMNDQ